MAQGLYVIVSTQCGETLFWNNADGWGDKPSAEKFTKPERDTLRLPIGGSWRKVSTAKRGA